MAGGRPREQTAAVLGCLLSSALALLAAGRTWATGTLEPLPPLPAREVSLVATQAGSSVRGLAVVGLAGAVAVVATRGWGRVLVGVLLVLTGLGIVVDAVSFDPVTAFGAALVEADSAAETAWPLVAAAAGVGLALAGAVVVARGRRWGGLSARYEPPAARSPDRPGATPLAHAGHGSSGDRAPGTRAPGTRAPGVGPSEHRPPAGGSREDSGSREDRDVWEALDRGDDPTATLPDPAPQPPPAGTAPPPPPHPSGR